MKDITPEDSVVPVYLKEPTKKDLQERERWAKEQEERELAQQVKIDSKQSALEKLATLGLTEEEIQAVIGS
jgi:hypothetical protein